MRINVINPRYLADQHLIAEYREIKMSTHYYRKSLSSTKGIQPYLISKTYTLNKGHAYMWYDKMMFVQRRFEKLLREMVRRDFTANYTHIDYTNIPSDAFGSYSVTDIDKKINLERILLRISKQPDWYKYEGESVKDWDRFYMDLFNEGEL